MSMGLTAQRAAAASKLGLAALGLLAALSLSACTTVEGTNAMTDAGTFEREVLNTTARGVGLIPGGEAKQDLTQARAPLVLPKNDNSLPPPTAEVASAQLPQNSDQVRVDTSNLSQADIERLRRARVVDLRSLSGRPLTEAEAKSLTARMSAAGMNVSVSGNRPLYLPPDDYFTRVGDANLVCRAANGDIVPLNDARCPEDVRRALRSRGPSSSGSSGLPDARLTETETSL